MTFVTVHAGHLYVNLRHQLFKFLSSDPRRREKLRGGNAGELEYSFLFEPAKAVGFFRVDRMSFQSFLSLQVSTQVPGELLTEVGQMCKSRVESRHVFDWLEYFLAGKARPFWKFCKVPAPPMAPFFQSQRLDGPYGGRFLFAREEREGSS